MATLYEYFVKDGAKNLTMHETWQIYSNDGQRVSDIIAKLHLDFDANAKYVSFFIPASDHVVCPKAMVLNKLEEVLGWPETSVEVSAGFGSSPLAGRELIFTGRIYFYSERPVRDDLRQRLLAEAGPLDHSLVFRSVEYATERNKWEKPHAFIAHDSRDKKEIAQPLSVQLQRLMCPVWYDEFSLKVGDSLRASIEAGLKACKKCVLILTPNFLSNKGWSKREYDSIFTRELVERQNVILPVWHQVSSDDVYKYSPILADRAAAQWSLGVEEVARRLLRSIDT